MPSFSEHIQQSKNNLHFLQEVSNKVDNCIDWQITICFYSAVHLINAFIADKLDYTYRTHVEVFDVINPEGKIANTRLTWPIYNAYRKLSNLSRRSRYLTKDGENGSTAFYCTEKHSSRAIINLDTLIKYINSEYGQDFDKVKISCDRLKGIDLQYFEIK